MLCMLSIGGGVHRELGDATTLWNWAHPCRAGSREAHEPQERDWRGGLCGEQAVELLRDFYAAGNPKGARFAHCSCQL